MDGPSGGAGWNRCPAPLRLEQTVDRPLLWWSAGAVFLVNAGLSAVEDRWGLATLQALTFLWAAVAGVTARVTALRYRASTATQTGGPDQAP
jgi:hypothetical protein